MAIAILSQGVFDFEPAAPTYTRSFAVPAGTDTLLVLPTLREIASAPGAPVITLLTYNDVALTAGFNNFAKGSTADINSLIGYLRNPSVGTFNVVMNSANTAGGAVWILALSGVKTTGSPVGNTAAQRISSSGSTSVGLGLTPTAGSMLLTALASGANTGTVTGFTGTGFTETITGRYGNNGDMPYTARYRLNVPASAVTTTATFSVASVNNGGVLAEILAEASATTDVSGSANATVAVTGSVASGLAQAEILDASFRQISTWTEMVTLQPDAAGVDRRIISAGVLGTPTLTLDQLAANKNYSWNYRLSDGIVRIDSASNTQTLSPHHLALVHNGALGQAIFLNGIPTGTVIEGAGLSGELVIATGGERIGSHGAISPGPYTGLFGRYLLYESAMTAEQVWLMALSESNPDAIWGIGSEDDAQVTNQSLVACPLHAELDGQPSVTLIPVILDPSGGALDITAVTQPANGTLAINELSLIYQPIRGWQGTDSATYTASDGIKSSTGRLTFRQTRPALKPSNDTVTVVSGGVVTFDPRSNDVGAGALTIVGYSGTVHGAVSEAADGRLIYTHAGLGGTSESFTYTVQDAYSQQSATVSVTITTGSFLSAGDVSTSTTQGNFVDIDVVAAASVSADLAPAVVQSGSITTPVLGTATLQAGGKIRYTPATGESGYTDQFNFTLKPSAAATPTDVGTASVQVTAISSLPKLQPDATINDRSKWHCVGFMPTGALPKASYPIGRAGFEQAVTSSTLVAGDVIILDDGTYSGSYLVCAKNGIASTDGSKHIMVRARNHGKAIVAHQLSVTGKYWWFTGIKFTYNGVANPHYKTDGQAVHAYADGFWLTNSRFTGYAFLNIHAGVTTNVRICYNTVNATTPADAYEVGCFITMIQQESDRPPGDTEIAWNRVTLATRSSISGGLGSRDVLILHPSHASGYNLNFVQREFKFHHNHCVGPFSELMYAKRNLCFEFNYMEWTNATQNFDVTYRHGLLTDNPAYDIGGIIRGNRFHASQNVTIELGGAGICVTCNVMEGGGSGDMVLYAGNTAKPFRDGCDHAQLVENTGFNTIIIGAKNNASDPIGADSAAGRNGLPRNIRIFKGDSGWNPTISPGSAASIPAHWGNGAVNGYGTGNAAKVATITVAALASAGCDTIA